MSWIIKENVLLTPMAVDKSVYYLCLVPDEDEPNDAIMYQPGDWLTVQCQNETALVESVLSLLQMNPDEIVTLRRAGEVTAFTALQSHLELTQLNPAILNKLQRQYQIGEWADRQAMMDYAKGRDIIDLLQAFPQLQTMGTDFLSLLSPLAPRYYSIASAPNKENRVAIAYKLVEYEGNGRVRKGVATHFMAQKTVGDKITITIQPNRTFKLPLEATTPIVMIGSGTGVAPFLGFMSARSQQQAGDNVLFFGETHRESCFLFEQEWQKWQEAGQLQLFTAFSRDQADKLYVQDVLKAQQALLKQQLEKGAVIYICGSQQQMAAGVERLFKDLFAGEWSDKQWDWDALKKAGRIQMDVY